MKSIGQAHHAVQVALREGLLVQKACEECGQEKTVAHHDDYTKPLDVRWLCRSCHRLWHNEHGRGLNAPAGSLFIGAQIPRGDAEELARLACSNERSVAAEMRVLIGNHLAAARTGAS